jgi:hypothetical protein
MRALACSTRRSVSDPRRPEDWAQGLSRVLKGTPSATAPGSGRTPARARKRRPGETAAPIHRTWSRASTIRRRQSTCGSGSRPGSGKAKPTHSEEASRRSVGPIEVALGCMLQALCQYNEHAASREAVGSDSHRPPSSCEPPPSLGNFSSTIRLRVPAANRGRPPPGVVPRNELGREKEGSAIVDLAGYAALSPFTSAVLVALSQGRSSRRVLR